MLFFQNQTFGNYILETSLYNFFQCMPGLICKMNACIEIWSYYGRQSLKADISAKTQWVKNSLKKLLINVLKLACENFRKKIKKIQSTLYKHANCWLVQKTSCLSNAFNKCACVTAKVWLENLFNIGYQFPHPLQWSALFPYHHNLMIDVFCARVWR